MNVLNVHIYVYVCVLIGRLHFSFLFRYVLNESQSRQNSSSGQGSSSNSGGGSGIPQPPPGMSFYAAKRVIGDNPWTPEQLEQVSLLVHNGACPSALAPGGPPGSRSAVVLMCSVSLVKQLCNPCLTLSAVFIVAVMC